MEQTVCPWFQKNASFKLRHPPPLVAREEAQGSPTFLAFLFLRICLPGFYFFPTQAMGVGLPKQFEMLSKMREGVFSEVLKLNATLLQTFCVFWAFVSDNGRIRPNLSFQNWNESRWSAFRSVLLTVSNSCNLHEWPWKYNPNVNLLMKKMAQIYCHVPGKLSDFVALFHRDIYDLTPGTRNRWRHSGICLRRPDWDSQTRPRWAFRLLH